MICYTGEDIGKPALRINAIEFGGFNQGEGDCHGFATMLRTGEHPILATKGHWLDGALTSIVVQFQKTIVEITRQKSSR